MVDCEDSGGGEEEEEGGVIKYMTMKEEPMQVNHITDACYHAQQPELIKTCSKFQAQITDLQVADGWSNHAAEYTGFIYVLLHC